MVVAYAAEFFPPSAWSRSPADIVRAVCRRTLCPPLTRIGGERIDFFERKTVPSALYQVFTASVRVACMAGVPMPAKFTSMVLESCPGEKVTPAGAAVTARVIALTSDEGSSVAASGEAGYSSTFSALSDARLRNPYW